MEGLYGIISLAWMTQPVGESKERGPNKPGPPRLFALEWMGRRRKSRADCNGWGIRARPPSSDARLHMSGPPRCRPISSRQRRAARPLLFEERGLWGSHAGTKYWMHLAVAKEYRLCRSGASPVNVTAGRQGMAA